MTSSGTGPSTTKPPYAPRPELVDKSVQTLRLKLLSDAEGTQALLNLAEELSRANCELSYQSDRGDHKVNASEWADFDAWQRSHGRSGS
jgi:hypothetical protein